MSKEQEKQEEQLEQLEQEEQEEEKIVCDFCEEENPQHHFFCYNCGGPLTGMNPEKALGIKITDEDMKDYVTIGFVTKEVDAGRFKVRISSLTLEQNLKTEEYADAETFRKKISSRTREVHKDFRTLFYGLKGIGFGDDMKSLNGLKDKEKENYINNMAKEVAAIVVQKIYYLHAAMGNAIQRGQVKDF